jgi:peroxiredoxin
MTPPASGNDGLVPAGTTAPAIPLPLLDDAGSRATVPRPGAKGLTLVAFFKESCPTCRFTLPFLQTLHRQVAAHGGSVVGVSQNDPHETAALREELGLTMPILIDAPDLALSRWFELVSVPTLYLIDESGAIRRGGMGFNKKDLAAMADELASSVNAAKPLLWKPEEQIPESRPG